MKMKTKATQIICLLTATIITIASLLGCESKQLILSQDSATLRVGESITLTCDIMPSGYSGELTWKSMNESIATVENGTITAISEGQVNIRVSGYGANAVCSVTVEKQTAYNQLSDNAKEFVDEFIKNGLATFKNSSSVNFVSIDAYKRIQSTNLIYLYFLVEISAQNSFGGNTSEYYVLDHGRVIEINKVTESGYAECKSYLR